MFAAYSNALGIKARLVCGLLLAVIALAPSAAIAKPAVPPAAGLDTATATGDGSQIQDVNISAQSGPTGDSPSGMGEFVVFTDGHVKGPVTCLQVTGNTAILNIQDQNGFGVVAVSLTDNGGNGQDVMSTLGGIGSSRAPTDCSPFVGFTELLAHGRATVFDAPPSPTSKEQCKDDGWRRFGFSNQGQCIRSVNRP
jgi:hypothetical protein